MQKNGIEQMRLRMAYVQPRDESIATLGGLEPAAYGLGSELSVTSDSRDHE